jgi:hypothetical protein
MTQTRTKTKTSPRNNLIRSIGLLALALANTAYAEDRAATEDAVNLCVEMRERIFECKEDFAEAFVAHHNPRPEQRQAMKAKALEEIIADGSGPLEPRRQVCAETMKRGPAPPADKIRDFRQSLADCAAKSGCPARVACLMPLMKDRIGKGKSVKR